MDASRARALAEKRPSVPTRGRSSSWDSQEPLGEHGRAGSGPFADPYSPERPGRTASNVSTESYVRPCLPVELCCHPWHPVSIWHA